MARISLAELKQLQKIYKTDKAIGKKIGMTGQGVHKMRQRYGLDFYRSKFEARSRRVIKQYLAGLNAFDIAKKNNISATTVYYTVYAKGVVREHNRKRNRMSKEEFLSLQKKLRTDRAIGEKFGVSRQAIQALRQQLGIEPVYNRGRRTKTLSGKKFSFNPIESTKK